MTDPRNYPSIRRVSNFGRGVLFAALGLSLSSSLLAETVNVSGMNDAANYANTDIVNTLGKASYNHTGTITGTSSLTINAPETTSAYRQWLKGANGSYSFTGPITVNGGQLLIDSGKLQTKSIILNGGDMYVMYADCIPHDAVIDVRSGSMLDVEGPANAIVGAVINIHDGGSFRLAGANHNHATEPITLNIAGNGKSSSLGAIQAYGGKNDLFLNANVNLTDDASVYLTNLSTGRQFIWSGKVTGDSTLTLYSDNAERWIRMENLDFTAFSGDFVVDKVKARFFAPSLGTGESITVQNSATAYFNKTDALAAYNGDFIVNDATISMETSGKLNNLSGNGSVTIGSHALTLHNTKASTFSGVISGTGSVTKTGAETLTFSGKNTFAGGMVIQEGKVISKGPNQSASPLGTGRITIEAGAILEFQTANQMGYGNSPNDLLIRGTLKPANYTHIKNVTLENGTIDTEYGFTSGGTGLDFATRTGVITSSGDSTINSRIHINNGANVTFDVTSGTLTVNGIIKSDGGFTKTGEGTLTLTAANTYSKGTTINAGTLAISSTTGLGTGKVTLNGGTLDASAAGNNKTFAYDVEVGANGGAITVAGGAYSSFNSLSGSGDLTTRGYASFGGNGGYDGHLTVADGYTRVSEGAFGNFDATVIGQLCIQTDGTLRVGKLNGTGMVFATKAGNVLELGAGTESTDTANFSGTIRGNGNDSKNLTIRKVGAGTQTLSRTGYLYGGTNNSFKEVIVDEGKLVVDAVHSVFTAGNTKGFFHCPITVNEGGTLEYVRYWTTSPNIDLTLNGGTLQLDNAQYLNKLNFNSGTVTLGSNDAPLRAGYNGTGVWNATGGNSVIENPVEIVKNGDHTTFTLNIADGASLEMKRNLVGLSSHPGSAVNVNGTGANGTGLLKLYSGSGLPKVAGLGTVTFNNADVQINGGMETWSGDGFFANDVVLTNADLNVNADAGKTVKLDRKISGNGTITKTGAGSMVLSGEEGEVNVESLTVSAGRANVEGSLTGDLAVAEGAVFSPGEGVGTLELNGDLSAESGSVLLFEQNASGMDSLFLASGSTLDIAEDAVLELLLNDVIPGATYTLIEAEDGLGDYADAEFWTDLLTAEDAYIWNLSIVGNTLQAAIDTNAVPEPAAWVLLVLGAAGLFIVRKKRV
ncbi:MAG: autotransporter-associated beta strand repeat-containing protein [Thermoguttaceae bacterium]|nr:autotransporter-associated beta strand repeat-containing protein [Thermoguttaceae bacterium]